MAKHGLNDYQPDYAVPPGDVLAAELELRGMTQQELAKRTGLTPKHIVALAKAKSAITPETAIKLERALGMPAQYWMNLESQYQENLARLEEEHQLERDLGWLKRIPVAAMAKSGWLQKHKDPKAQLIEVLRFFGIASVDQWAKLWPNLNVAYRQHNSRQVFPEAVSAWLRQGEIEASRMQCEPFDKARFRSALDEIRGLTTMAPEIFVSRMQDLGAGAGVAIVFVPALPKSGVSGATRWVSPHKAVIQLSLRYKTDDHLWFTFFHEAGHILLHGKKELFIEGGNGLDEAKEREADEFAQAELIPKKSLAAFIEQKAFSKAAIEKFARELGICAGIVVGQLQHNGALPHTHCNDLKRRFKWATD
jgi:addiction module HigA family antidote